MQHLDNDMDDLFRKAGENYPLKAQPDWEKFSKELEASTPAKNSSGKRNRKNRWLLLLLLLPFSWICTRYWPGSSDVEKLNKDNKEMVEKKQDMKVDDKNESPQKPSTSTEVSTLEKSMQEENPVTSVEKDQNSLSYYRGKTEDRFKLQSLQDKASYSYQDASEQKTDASRLNSQSENATQQDIRESIENNTSSKDKHTLSKDESTLMPATETEQKRNTVVNATSDTTASLTNASPSNKQSKKVKAVNKQKGLYIGVLAGTDINTIKFQQAKNGYTLGFIAGYRLNKHLSFETGFYFDKKNYYSKGKYFDKARTTIPADVKIQDLDGYCKMFEIPITARYDFALRPKGNFYVSAGLSSYLMKKEFYTYTAEYYGEEYTTSKTYLNSVNNFFSIMHAGIGYQFKLNNKTNLRFEPYFKIPLGGVGIGKLPVTSAGIYAGITHSFK